MAPRRQLDRLRVHLPQTALPSQQYLSLLLNLHHNRDRLREVTFAYFIIPPLFHHFVPYHWASDETRDSEKVIQV